MTSLHQRIRSKSIADVFQAAEIEEDQEDLLPGQNQGSLKSTLEKWKSNLVMNFQLSTPSANGHQRMGRARADSIFTRPPTHPHPRRQSLAEMFRRPIGLKEDIKKIWDRRPSLSGLRDHLKYGASGRSTDSIPHPTVYQNNPSGYKYPTPHNSFSQEGPDTDDNEIPIPSFFIVDRTAWKVT